MIIIDTAKERKLTLAPATEQEAREQELYILISTIKGECPLYRDFGIASDYLHMPTNAAQTSFTMAVTEALKRYMPDVTLDSIRFNFENGMQGIAHPILEVSDL